MIEIIAVFVPLVAFAVSFLLGGTIGHRGAQFLTCAGLICSAVLSVWLFNDVALNGNGRTTDLMTWITSGDFSVDWALRIDTLSVVMMCVITIMCITIV